jgi:RND family efflux transporter MFP subunit
VAMSDFEEGSLFIGTLEAQERVILRPEIQGRILEILVLPGDQVSQGDPIVQLQPDQAQAQVNSAVANADAVQAAQETAIAQLNGAKSSMDKATADIRLAEIEYERAKELFEQGVQPKHDLDVAERNLALAKTQINVFQDQIDAAQAQLNQAESSLQQAQAQVDVNNENLRFKQIEAPISGVVGDFPVKVGDVVNLGDTLTTITQNDSLELNINVPASRANELQVGLPVQLINTATDEVIVTGSIDFVAPEVSNSAQSIAIKAQFPNPDGNLREGQTVRAKIIWQTAPGLLIPTVAVSRIGGQDFVFVAAQPEGDEAGEKTDASQQIVKQTPVQGSIQGDRYVVTDGIDAGANIAVTNILKLRDGGADSIRSRSVI